jgi:hypothetical protein
MSAGPGRPKEYVNVRVNAGVKEQLTQLAAKEGLDLSNYMRKHYLELVQSGSIVPEEDIRIPNPAMYPPTVPPGYIPQAQPQPQYYQQPYQPQYYYPPSPYAAQPDPLDSFISKMEKMAVAQMFQDMVNRKASPTEVVAAAKGKADKDEFSMQDLMKMNMIQAQIDKQYQQQQMYAQNQLAQAQAKGDKQGESKALELITALTTAQMQQQQNFMQQFMLANQQASATQQTLFTTAMQGSRAQDDLRSQERNQFNTQLQGMQQSMTTVQLAGIENANRIQVEFLRADLERIRNEPKKDVIAQMGELLTMRNTNPVYKAAFDAAFGIKDGGGIGDLLPKLKDLGIDKVIDRVVSVLGSLVSRPQIPQPTIPQPTILEPQQAIPMPGPMAQPTPAELQKLSQTGLPQTPGQPVRQPPETIQLEKPDNVGYSNLEVEKPPEERVQIPAPSESIQIPAPPEKQLGYSNLDKIKEPTQPSQPIQPSQQPTVQEPEVIPPDEAKVWTAGRPRGSKNKPKTEPEPTGA